MRKIDIQEFFAKARQDPNSAWAIEAFSGENFPGADGFETVEEAKAALVERLTAPTLHIARLNGCVCRDIEEHFLDVIALREEMAEGDLSRFLGPAGEEEGFLTRFSNLARSYAMQKKCHTTQSHYICYCDEQDGCPFGDHEVMLKYESHSGIPYCALCTKDLPEWVVEKLRKREEGDNS